MACSSKEKHVSIQSSDVIRRACLFRLWIQAPTSTTELRGQEEEGVVTGGGG